MADDQAKNWTIMDSADKKGQIGRWQGWKRTFTVDNSRKIGMQTVMDRNRLKKYRWFRWTKK